MGKYKKIEKLLYNYKMLKISIENLENDIKILDEEDGVSGISFDEVATSPTNSISSVVEDTILSTSEKKHYLRHKMKSIKNTIEKLDNSISALTDTEQIIIKGKYIEGDQWWKVAENAGYTDRQCKNIRRVAIKKLMLGYYGTMK